VGKVVAGGNGKGYDLNQFLNAKSLCCMGDVLYIADNGNNRVMKWEIGATSGTIVAGVDQVKRDNELSKLRSPEGVTINKAGTLFVTDEDDEMHFRVTRWRKGAKEGETVIPAKKGHWFTGITLDEQEEHLYVGNSSSHTVLKYEIGNSTNEQVVAGG
jgi:sugar lactone lactonase YvrE